MVATTVEAIAVGCCCCCPCGSTAVGLTACWAGATTCRRAGGRVGGLGPQGPRGALACMAGWLAGGVRWCVRPLQAGLRACMHASMRAMRAHSLRCARSSPLRAPLPSLGPQWQFVTHSGSRHLANPCVCARMRVCAPQCRNVLPPGTQRRTATTPPPQKHARAGKHERTTRVGGPGGERTHRGRSRWFGCCVLTHSKQSPSPPAEDRLSNPAADGSGSGEETGMGWGFWTPPLKRRQRSRILPPGRRPALLFAKARLHCRGEGQQPVQIGNGLVIAPKLAALDLGPASPAMGASGIVVRVLGLFWGSLQGCCSCSHIPTSWRRAKGPPQRAFP